jgi:hypothetical protein
MQKRKLIVVIAVAVVGAAAWYAFRPERLFINQTVNESFPTPVAAASATSAQPATLYAGRFHSGTHKTLGNATIYRLPNGNRVLRLSEFETSNGPDLHLYLVAAPDATDNDSVKKAGFVTLGALKGNMGDQNYGVPSDLDLGKYRSVTVWCRRFGFNFGTAPLSEAGQSATMAAAPMEVASGKFHGVAHKSMGKAAIFRLEEDKRVLRLTEFETSNGPDLQLYLVAADDATDNEMVKKAGFVSLGALKGNKGDQNYDVPSNIDLARYRSVTVWCRRFGVNFATAPLTQPQTAGN